jgi:protoheme IX farnesyltransferase
VPQESVLSDRNLHRRLGSDLRGQFRGEIPGDDLHVAGGTGAREQTAPAGLGALLETTKPRITRLVTITSLVGFAMAAMPQSWQTQDLVTRVLACAAGTALASSGANALNQWMERRRDGLMPRTKSRPLPAGRSTPGAVALWGTALCVVGVAVLWAFLGAAPAGVAVLTILTYLLLYTPMKPLTPWATLVGAVPGALPPLIGWTAATGPSDVRTALDAGGLSLFALMVAWQVPHVIALSWMYKDDYALGGYRVLPVVDRTGGRATSAWMLASTVLLLPATLAPAWAMPDLLGRAPWVYALTAAITGVMFIALTVRLARRRTRDDARAAFFFTIAHLPLLLAVMVGEAAVRTFLL